MFLSFFFALAVNIMTNSSFIENMKKIKNEFKCVLMQFPLQACFDLGKVFQVEFR